MPHGNLDPMKTKMSFLVVVAVIGLSARGAEFYADFGEVVGKVRPELHGSGMGGQLVGGISGREPELLGPLGLWGARTHDWALINPGQRICDTHFVFPLMHLDPADPANYVFGPTDEILDRSLSRRTPTRSSTTSASSSSSSLRWGASRRDSQTSSSAALRCATATRAFCVGFSPSAARRATRLTSSRGTTTRARRT